MYVVAESGKAIVTNTGLDPMRKIEELTVNWEVL